MTPARRIETGELAMKFVKTLVLIVCACTLQACATYYYSSPPGAKRTVSSEDGYYYGSGVGYATIDYSSIPYYPWWSMDYYYLGPHYYTPWYAGYASGWYTSLGFNFAYPPYYRPYGFAGNLYYPYSRFGWHDPWFGWSGYGAGVNFVWHDYYWRKLHRDHSRDYYPEPVRDEYGNSRYPRRDPGRDLYNDPRDRAPASYSAERAAARSRNVSTAPSYRTGDTGMQVRSRRDRKVQESHIGPAPVQSPTVPVTNARSISAAPVAPSQPVATTPRPVRQAPPPQASPREPARPVASPPRMIRQAPPPQAQPRSKPPRSSPPPAPAMPSRSQGGSESGAPDYDKSGSRRRN